MATKVHMEALSPTMEEGQVVRWLKAEGDAVSNGDVLAEIETDKATMELVARGDGLLRAILLDEGGVAPVGEVIGVIATDDEDISDLVGSAGGGGGGGGEAKAEPAAPEPAAQGDEGAEGDEDTEDTPDAKAASDAPPEASAEESEEVEDKQAADGGEKAAGDGTGEDPAEQEEAAATAKPAPSGNGHIKASPVARRLATEAGVDLSMIAGTGPGGRIIKRDVEERIRTGETEPAQAPAASESPAPTSPTRPAAPATVPGSGPEYEDIPLSQMRKTIAKRLVESIGPVPHFFLTIQVDMSQTMAARKRINETLAERGEKVSLNDMIIRAAGSALIQHPAVNAHWMGDSVRRFNRAHIGVAVAVEDGLITPVIRDAHAKGIAQIAREVKEMAGRAREKKLKPDEYTGATFSISNLGMFGIHEFTAVINPPEAAILAIGGIEQTPVVEDGELTTVPMMRVTMSCDHRTIDGATGSRFLQTFRAMLEDPVAMLL